MPGEREPLKALLPPRVEALGRDPAAGVCEGRAPAPVPADGRAPPAPPDGRFPTFPVEGVAPDPLPPFAPAPWYPRA